MISYRSEHPNHVHQLVASVSKHYYATKDGYLKYQQKPVEISLAAVAEQTRSHLILFSLRDHCTGLFYAEVGFGPRLPSITDFLTRAWSPKVDYAFHGLPRFLTIPQTVEAAFPGLGARVRTLGIELIEVTNGFQSGVRDVKTLEESLRLAEGQPLNRAAEWVQYTYFHHATEKSRNKVQSKLELWCSGVPSLRIPSAEWQTIPGRP